ncbi:MAG: FtsQ-type POTRA domain-containing protein [Gemmatimonadetes bacterium]|nr:FtsQ-type POTRA domain-containing protein [Gemmatimonadota bacterium]
MAAAALVLVATTAPWWGPAVLEPLSFFAVRRVEVVGARYLPAEAIVAALGLGDRASVWENPGRLERRLRALGGIDRARVVRRLPGTLRVTVREVEPVALAPGPDGLVAVAGDGRPLPYDPTTAPVDAPVLARAERPLLAVLATIQATDPGLFSEIAAARAAGGGEVVLELSDGRVRLGTTVDPEVVRSVSAARRDLVSRGRPWSELDARFRGWVIARTPPAAGRAS